MGRAAVLVHLRVRAARRISRAARRQDHAQRCAAHWRAPSAASSSVSSRGFVPATPSTGCAVHRRRRAELPPSIRVRHRRRRPRARRCRLGEGKDTATAPRLLRRAGKAAVREAGGRHPGSVGRLHQGRHRGLAGGPADLRPFPRPVLAHDALDTVRRQQARAADPRTSKLSRARASPCRKPRTLTDVDKASSPTCRRPTGPRTAPTLLKETLARIRWCTSPCRQQASSTTVGSRSRLPPFRRVAHHQAAHRGHVAYAHRPGARAQRRAQCKIQRSPDAASASIPPPASSPSSTCAACPTSHRHSEAHASTKPDRDPL